MHGETLITLNAYSTEDDGLRSIQTKALPFHALMLGGIGGSRRRGRQRMRWLDGITDSMGVSLMQEVLTSYL